MNANKLADELDNMLKVVGLTDNRVPIMLRQQQAEIEELEKENTDLRYLIATKLEQQDGISLNSMAHPITNTPEPSYEIDPDKLETIEIDLPSPEPVAWIKQNSETLQAELHFDKPAKYWATVISNPDIPLYTHPVKELTDEEILIICFDTGITGWKLSDGNMDAEIMLDFARAILRKASEK